jgi:hypothetical protein
MPEVQDPPAKEAAQFTREQALASMQQAHKTEPRPKAEPTVQPPAETKVVQTDATKPPAQDHTPKGLREALEREIKARKDIEEKLKGYEGLKPQLEAVQAERDKFKTDYESTAKQAEELGKLQSVAALEQSRPFQEKYVQGKNMLVTRLTQQAEMAGIAPADLIEAASKSGKERYTAIEEVISQAPRLLQDDLIRTIRDIDHLDADKSAELSQASEKMQERIREQETGDRRTREERQRAKQEAWDTTSTRLKTELGADDDTIKKAAEFYQSNRDLSKTSEIVIKGHAYDAMKAERDALKAEVLGYQGQTPGLRSGGGKLAPADPDAKVPLHLSMNKRAAAGWQGR